jgi:hypothetical protein
VTAKKEELVDEGWQRRFIASEPRLSEMKAMYEETGFEVRLEPLAAGEEMDEACQGCSICFSGREDSYRVIYTRRQRDRERPKKR